LRSSRIEEQVEDTRTKKGPPLSGRAFLISAEFPHVSVGFARVLD
jgi:hypothetical protein